MARKTADIERLKEMANGVLLHTPDDQDVGRVHIQLFIESVLMEAGQYNGFKYLTPRDMFYSDNGTSYGINPAPEYAPDGWDRFEGTDHTRVKYL